VGKEIHIKIGQYERLKLSDDLKPAYSCFLGKRASFEYQPPLGVTPVLSKPNVAVSGGGPDDVARYSYQPSAADCV
jgi:hypothetical protein